MASPETQKALDDLARCQKNVETLAARVTTAEQQIGMIETLRENDTKNLEDATRENTYLRSVIAALIGNLRLSAEELEHDLTNPSTSDRLGT